MWQYLGVLNIVRWLKFKFFGLIIRLPEIINVPGSQTNKSWQWDQENLSSYSYSYKSPLMLTERAPNNEPIKKVNQQDLFLSHTTGAARSTLHMRAQWHLSNLKWDLREEARSEIGKSRNFFRRFLLWKVQVYEHFLKLAKVAVVRASVCTNCKRWRAAQVVGSAGINPPRCPGAAARSQHLLVPDTRPLLALARSLTPSLRCSHLSKLSHSAHLQVPF
jgi:hypothetical protein